MTRGEQWFRSALQVRHSVIPAILSRTLLCGAFGVFIAVLHELKFPVAMPALASLVPSIVLGLLLVFRTNTAYERFWEGRKAWGGMVNSCRNLARQIWVAFPARHSSDRAGKVAALKLLVAFAVATKLHLRGEVPNDELAALMSPEKFTKIQTVNSLPLQVSFWIGDYLQQHYNRGDVNSYQLSDMHLLLNDLVGHMGACERILKTPMPMAYAIHLKQLLLLYCLSLPFQMVGSVGWWTGPIVVLISFTLFGIEEIGIEIENPFGRDENDLPLDLICDTMYRNLMDLISSTPSTSHHLAADRMAADRIEELVRE
jgi:putative membrane protein